MDTVATEGRHDTVLNGNPILDARPDTIDFRDQMYVATLTEVPVEKTLAERLAHKG
jgi:hypothetical protein